MVTQEDWKTIEMVTQEDCVCVFMWLCVCVEDDGVPDAADANKNTRWIGVNRGE